MVMRVTRSCGCGSKARRPALGVALALAAVALAGCSPVETYRNMIGVSKNDPNPATTPNTKNLAAGEAQGYPNLATVPAPPAQALTTAQLDKLTQSLIADRKNAKYTGEQLQAGFDEAGAAPPPAPPPPPAAGEGNAAGAAGAGGPAGASSAPQPVPPASPARPNPGSAAPPPAAAAKGLRKSGEPPEPGPAESSLQSPRIASLPQPEKVEAAPPPPPQLTMPAAAPAQNAGPKPAHLPGPPAPAPLPPEIGSAKFQPAPPPPNLPPPTPMRTAAGKAEKPPSPPAAYTHIADIGFAADSVALSDAARQTITQIVPRYQAKPGVVRVVGYAGVGSGAAQQLNSYRTALDRAHAVAGALAKAGIPSDKIQVEAAPLGGDSGQGRAEVLLQQ